MKPMLFNTEMVRAILEGRKTVTRRVIKGYPLEHLELDIDGSIIGVYEQFEGGVFPIIDYAPHYPGEILYVRETWCDPSGTGYPFLYKADMPMHWDAEETEMGLPVDLRAEDYTWRPSIHMPKEAARLFLRVTDVRVERLRAMGIEDAKKEGVIPTHRPGGCKCRFAFDGCKDEPCANRTAYEIERHMDPFIQLWDSTIKPVGRALYGWAANPWVWVIEFERCERPKED